MRINTLTKKFRDDLLELVNNSGLPICVIELVMENTLVAVRTKLTEVLALELEAEFKKEEEKNE